VCALARGPEKLTGLRRQNARLPATGIQLRARAGFKGRGRPGRATFTKRAGSRAAARRRRLRLWAASASASRSAKTPGWPSGAARALSLAGVDLIFESVGPVTSPFRQGTSCGAGSCSKASRAFGVTLFVRETCSETRLGEPFTMAMRSWPPTARSWAESAAVFGFTEGELTVGPSVDHRGCRACVTARCRVFSPAISDEAGQLALRLRSSFRKWLPPPPRSALADWGARRATSKEEELGGAARCRSGCFDYLRKEPVSRGFRGVACPVARDSFGDRVARGACMVGFALQDLGARRL